MKFLLLNLTVFTMILAAGCLAAEVGVPGSSNATVQIKSGGLSYPAYVGAPEKPGKYPGIVLIHSFNGLEPGYKDLVDRFAAEGFVVVAPEWQTFNQSPPDDVVKGLVSDSVGYLVGRSDVDPARLGLTGFCAGGRYTMLFLPQIGDFRSGVAFYGFPYRANNQTAPASLIPDLHAPLLMIHGTRDKASPVADIYRYAVDLDSADKYFELKVYQGEPHGFMVQNGQLSQSFPARDAYTQMVTFFERTLT